MTASDLRRWTLVTVADDLVDHGWPGGPIETVMPPGMVQVPVRAEADIEREIAEVERDVLASADVGGSDYDSGAVAALRDLRARLGIELERKD